MVLFFVLIIALIVAEQECIEIVPDPQDGDLERGCITKWVFGGGGGGQPPIVTITGPTNMPVMSTYFSSVFLSGTATDNVGVVNVTWRNNTTGVNGGTFLTNPGGMFTIWFSGRIALASGANQIVVTAIDTAGNTATDTIIVTYSNPPSNQIDLAPQPTSMNQYGIEPLQATRSVPYIHILIKNKATMVRGFINLFDNQGVKQIHFNTLNQPSTVEISINGTSFDSMQVVYYNWYDYADPYPFNPVKIRTYVLPANNQLLIQQFGDYVNAVDLNGIRKLVFQDGIDAVNLFEGDKSYTETTNNLPLFRLFIDSTNSIVEQNENNNVTPAQSFGMFKIHPDIKFDNYIAYYSRNPEDFTNTEARLRSKIFKHWQYLIATYPIPTNGYYRLPTVIFLKEACPDLIDTKSESQVINCLKKLNGYNWVYNLF
ncbi:MAG: hypothetical protein Q7R33_03475 [Nitrosarchaeum sp.]|nr:hypothetical protein [Nitrosarchaeum sp.]